MTCPRIEYIWCFPSICLRRFFDYDPALRTDKEYNLPVFDFFTTDFIQVYGQILGRPACECIQNWQKIPGVVKKVPLPVRWPGSGIASVCDNNVLADVLWKCLEHALMSMEAVEVDSPCAFISVIIGVVVS